VLSTRVERGELGRLRASRLAVARASKADYAELASDADLEAGR
jgi:hypothetical protein